MQFIRQIKLEIRNILKSRFLFIIAILTILIAIAVPVLSYVNLKAAERDAATRPTTGGIYYAQDMVYYEKMGAAVATMRPDGYYSKGEPITIDGVTISMDHPLYWNLQSLLYEKQVLSVEKNPFDSPAALDLALKLMDAEISYYVPFARVITTYQDYRLELVQRGVSSVYDKFFFENGDKSAAILESVASQRKYVDPSTIKTTYVDITSEKRLAGIDKATETIRQLQDIVTRNDFPAYISLRMDLARDEIKSLEENIAIQERAIVANPAQEASLNQIIENLRIQINTIETGTIPILEYRLKKMIIPGLDIWQNRALSDMENARSQLAYLKILTPEEWQSQGGGSGGIGIMPIYREDGSSGQTYAEYVTQMQKQIDQANKTVIIAQKSLDSDRPDMKYVPEGSRRRTIGFLSYSLLIMLFGVMLGGWLIASEYQQGTIRLLMIRPRTRTKILLSKFAAALIVWVVVDLLSSFLNMFTTGVFFGFADFAFPNYSVGGATGFLAYYFPRLLACMLPILFSFTIAFMLSVTLKNIAVSVAIPVVLYIVSFITMNIFMYRTGSSWINYTPLPYMQLATLYAYDSSGMFEYTGLSTQNLNMTFGMLLLFGLSVCFTAFTVLVFKKRDIVN